MAKRRAKQADEPVATAPKSLTLLCGCGDIPLDAQDADESQPCAVCETEDAPLFGDEDDPESLCEVCWAAIVHDPVEHGSVCTGNFRLRGIRANY